MKLFFALLLLLTGCGDDQIVALQNKAEQQQYESEDLTKRIEAMEQRLSSTEGADRWTPINFSKNTFLPVETSLGNLVVAPKKVEPYLTGYRVRVSIGNPLAATISSFKIVARTSRSSNSLSPLDKSKHPSAQIREFPFTRTLEGSSWNDVEFVLHPLSPEELKSLSIRVETTGIRLKESR